MSDHISIHNSEFDRTVTLRDAYYVMEQFVEMYYHRGETDLASFISYSCLDLKGTAGDPAALPDFLNAVAETLDLPAAG